MHVPVAGRYNVRLSKLTATGRSLTQDTVCDGIAILLRLDKYDMIQASHSTGGDPIRRHASLQYEPH
jgi:hypothetical protein